MPTLRRVFAVLLATAAVLTAAVPAWAVGVNGVELEVDLPTRGDQRPVLAVGEEPTTTTVLLRNIVDGPRTVRLYAVSASVGPAGTSLGGPGSASWLGFEERTVELAAGERRLIEFTTGQSALPEDGEAQRTAALVVEAGDGTLVTRGARLIEIRGAYAPPPLLLVLAAVAVGLLIVALAAHAAAQRMERRRSARPSVTVEAGAATA